MPRKVTDKIVSAFLAGQTAKQANTSTDGNSFYLHGNEIAKMENGDLWVTNAGWNTRTTYERLNGLPGVSVSVKQGKPYLNGVPWDGKWINVGKVGQSESYLREDDDCYDDEDTKVVENRVRNILKTIIKEEVARVLSKKKVLTNESLEESGYNPRNPKVDLQYKDSKGEWHYLASTTWSKTVKEAVQNMIESLKNPQNMKVYSKKVGEEIDISRIKGYIDRERR